MLNGLLYECEIVSSELNFKLLKYKIITRIKLMDFGVIKYLALA